MEERTTSCAPEIVERFTTGARHYVYDVEFADRARVVVRIGDQSHSEMAGAIYRSRRRLGVRLPAILAENVQAELQWLLMKRLPGTDARPSTAPHTPRPQSGGGWAGVKLR